MAHHMDSPCANVKQNKWPRLPILTTEMESSSDESDGNCGYDPDSESDDQNDESSRVLKSKYLDSPESLREAPPFAQPPMSRSPPTLESRKRAPSVPNLAKLVGNNEKNSTKVMASTMLDGQQCEDPLDFVPDVSSVDKRGESTHLRMTSVLKEASNGKEGTKDEQFQIVDKSEARKKMESVSFAIPENQKSSFLIKKTSTPGECKRPKERWEVLSSIHSSEADGFLLVPRQQREILTDEERGWSSLPGTSQNQNSQEMLLGSPQNHTSQKILPGTPQNHTVLTSSRKEASAKRLARIKRGRDTEALADETITNELKNNNCNESDDNLIIIEDGESPVSNSTDKSKLEESIKLCEFPIDKSGAVIVAMQDYATLDSGTFVNDIIIDFYIKFLEQKVLPSGDQGLVQIFSTMFYKRLLQSPKISKKLAFYETDSTLTVNEKRHYRVAGWTKNIDLFSMKMIIVPICENSHWFLLILVNPGALFDPAGSGAPCIIVLDSMGGDQTSAVNNLRGYLAWEWKKRKCGGGDPVEEINFSSKELPAIYPEKPEQDNGVDCGIFLLHYVEKIFQNVTKFLSVNLPELDLSMWFTMQEVGQKRARIAELIRQLAKEQCSHKIINYLDIKIRSNEKPLVIVTNDNGDVVKPENTKPEEFKEKSAKRFYSYPKGVSNVRQSIKKVTKKPPKIIPNSAETSMSVVKYPSPRMRRQPLHSSGVKEESPTQLSFQKILEENLKQVATETQSDNEPRKNESEVKNEAAKNTTQLDLVDIKQDNIEKEIDSSNSKMRLMEALNQSLLLISPKRSKLEGSHEVAGSSSMLYKSPDISLETASKFREVKLRDKINQSSTRHYKRKVTSLNSLSSSGEVSTTDTSADLFTPGRGIPNVVPCPKENEMKIQPTKKFKLASRVKCSRFNDNDTKTQETFERLMNDESSGEGSDVFSLED